MINTKKKIYCFGELLWDLLPGGKEAGGAPMNVAFHLNRLNIDGHPITALGKDDLGKELIAFLDEKNIPVADIQWNDYPTGQVEVHLNERKEASYTIIAPSAWDYIISTESLIEQIQEADAFVYGSLVTRNEVSAETLFSLLPYSTFTICDINLRVPFYNREKINELIKKADWLKINDDELKLISSWYHSETAERNQAIFLFEKYPMLDAIIITRGSNGAAYHTRDLYTEHNGFKVEVTDTVGSGDSFLAMFIASYFAGMSAEQCLERACAMGAILASHRGPTPVFDIEQEVDRMIHRVL